MDGAAPGSDAKTKLGRPVGRRVVGNREKVSVCLDRDLMARMRERSAAQGRYLCEVMEEAFGSYLEGGP